MGSACRAELPHVGSFAGCIEQPVDLVAFSFEALAGADLALDYTQAGTQVAQHVAGSQRRGGA